MGADQGLQHIRAGFSEMGWGIHGVVLGWVKVGIKQVRQSFHYLHGGVQQRYIKIAFMPAVTWNQSVA